ncbi:hypothetical protein FQA39_LY09708 [Lamprigera yunnana]|nr:hypothetical protein FQA39_LY09708 [Lamprigera yunnana]
MKSVKFVISFCLISVFCQRNEDFLPKTVIPIRYTLTFEPINDITFRGNVLIEIETLEVTNRIVLHVKHLDINQHLIKIVDSVNKNVKLTNTTIDDEKDFYIINLDEDLVPYSNYNISIDKFIGKFGDDKLGIILAKYQTKNNTISTVVVTEFEPLGARRAFPCFDEPHLKATFVVNVKRPSFKHSTSNMPLKETIGLSDGNFQDVFHESPLMSTYLVAFVISDFKYTESNGIIRILAPPKFVDDDSLDYVLNESAEILKTLEEFTGVKYTLPKLDMVAIPRQYFIDGAMENWGLITYNDKYLLCPKNSSAIQFQICFTYSVHEFAHQWFGNLATQSKWNYVWLSEGFAAYFQYHLADKIKPHWRLREQFVLDSIQRMFKEIDIDETIDYVFKAREDFPSAQIYYQKASAIIRMTEHILGSKVFQRGLQIYLSKHKFRNADPSNLYDSYNEAVKEANVENVFQNLTIHEILRTWTSNPGYPIVTVLRNYDTGSISFSQKCSLSDYNNTLWYIPITYVLSEKPGFDFENTTTDFWITTRNDTFYSGVSDGWLIVNKLHSGYYQVNYDETNWIRITNFMISNDFEKISPLNRAQLINDAFYFAKSNLLNPDIFFNLTMYLVKETDFVPIASFLNNMEVIEVDLLKLSEKKLFRIYLKALLNNVYTKLGVESKPFDTHIDKLNREQILRNVCSFDEKCKQYKMQQLRKFISMKGDFSITDSDAATLCSLMKIAGPDEWEFVLHQYSNMTDTALKKMYLTSLLCTENEKLIKRCAYVIFNLNYTMTAQDRTDSLNKVLSNSEIGKEFVINYLLNLSDVDKYVDAFSADPGILIVLDKTQLAKYHSTIKKLKLPIFLFEDEDRNDMSKHFLSWFKKYSPNAIV